jgi:outer membrane receptor protein involved in Fe transport
MRNTVLAASLAILLTGTAAARAESDVQCGWNVDRQGVTTSATSPPSATCPLDIRTHIPVVDPSGLEVEENWQLNDTFDGGARYERTEQLPGHFELNRYLTVGNEDPSGLSPSDDISVGLTYRP